MSHPRTPQPSSFAARWQGFWFSSEGDLSIGIIRIAVASAALWAMWLYGNRDYKEFFYEYGAHPYHPRGILGLYGNSPPPASFFNGLKYVGGLVTLMSLVGLYCRTTTFLSLISGLLLLGVQYSYFDGTCHGFNAIFLAQIILTFVPGSQTLSLDGRLRKGQRSSTRHLSTWGVRLSQIGVSFMFLSAALQKLKADQFQLGWTSGDNFRFHLIRRYPLLGEEVPSHLVWLMNHETACSAVAWMNLFAQMLPFASCFFFHRPLVRLALGATFLLEMVGLGVVMGLWDFHLFPLFLVFVDWDYFAAKRHRGPHPVPASLPMPSTVPLQSLRAYGAGTIAALGFLGVLLFHPDRGIETKLNLFPFTNFAMYSDVYEKKAFVDTATEIEILAPSLAPDYRRLLEVQFQHTFTNLAKGANPQRIRATLDTISRYVEKLDAERVAIFSATYQFPPFPEPFEKQLAQRTLLGAFSPREGTYLVPSESTQ